MNARRLCVALPVRNGENFLAAALDSILAQTFADFDLFVSDNASADGTAAVLADYARRDPRVKPSRSAAMISQMANMNRAMALADTPWVKLFCHDDLMEPDCLARIDAAIGAVEGTAVALIGNGERHLFGNGYRTQPPPSDELLVVTGRDAIARKLWDVARAIPFPAITTATVRQDAFAAVGGFDERYVYFDLFCWLEMLTRYDYAALTAPLTVNRIHAGQVAHQARASLREFDDFRAFLPRFLERHGDALDIPARARLRVRLIPAALAARALAERLAAGRPSEAARLLRALPARFWPLLAPLTARAWLGERRRLRENAANIPREVLYPT